MLVTLHAASQPSRVKVLRDGPGGRLSEVDLDRCNQLAMFTIVRPQCPAICLGQLEQGGGRLTGCGKSPNLVSLALQVAYYAAPMPYMLLSLTAALTFSAAC